MNLEEKANGVVGEFSLFDDWLEKYNYLIEQGRNLPLIDPVFKDASHLINGCQSQVWLHAELREGLVLFTADSDAIITKGIASLLIRVLSGETPDAILACDLGFLGKIGLMEHLSPTRSNGMSAMIKQMKLYALAFKARQQS